MTKQIKTSPYIYGEAAGNMHGDLDDAVLANVITKKERFEYSQKATCVMSGRIFKGEFPENTQLKLDKFFKGNEIDYTDFTKLCREKSGERFPTVCCPDAFLKGARCYYDEKGNAINVNFTSRFDAVS